MDVGKVCTSRRLCVEVMGGVWKSWLFCGSRGCCVKVIGPVCKVLPT